MKIPNSLKILIIEDDELFAIGLKVALANEGELTHASNPDEANKLMAQKHFDLALIDMDYDGVLGGPDLVERACGNGIFAVVLSGNDSSEVIELAYQKGARDYLPKLNYVDHIRRVLEHFHQYKSGPDFNRFAENFFLTRNLKTLQELATIPLLKGNQKNVFISGPTGVGKGLVAQMIHSYQRLPKEKFVAINCSALSPQLLESELFGHEKGAFTGAISLYRGKLEQADGGTLFLDEVGTMPQELQVKLLKALEEKTFYRVGGQRSIHSRFRVVSASWENILKMVQEGKFRPDLYFRLSGLNIQLPGLAERKEDLWPLIKLFMNQEGRMLAFSPAARILLEHHPWPGNVRELKKCIEALCLTKKGVVEEGDVRSILAYGGNASSSNLADMGAGQIRFVEDHGLPAFIAEIEKLMVERSEKKYQGKVRAIMKELKISSTTYYRIAEAVHASGPNASRIKS